MKFLLDTNTCVAALRGMPKAVIRLSSVSPDDCALSTVTLYELMTGAVRCRNPRREADKIRAFSAPLHVVAFDEAAAKAAASIRWDLEKNGTPIGPYDLLLAGQAVSLDLILISHNLREFQRIPQLHVESWET